MSPRPPHYPHRLPLEILLDIFRLLTATSLEDARVVSQVCSQARKLALPHVFSTVAGLEFLRSLPEHVRPYVQNIWLDEDLSAEEASALSWTLTSARILVLPPSFLELCKLPASPRLTFTPSYLTLTLVDWFAIKQSPHTWASVTHMYIFDLVFLLPQLPQMPRLTHFALKWWLHQTENLPALVAHYRKHWEMVAVVCHPTSVEHPDMLAEGVRALLSMEGGESLYPVLGAHDVDGARQEWARDIASGDDIWKRAVRLRTAVLNNDLEEVTRIWHIGRQTHSGVQAEQLG